MPIYVKEKILVQQEKAKFHPEKSQGNKHQGTHRQLQPSQPLPPGHRGLTLQEYHIFQDESEYKFLI